MKLRAVIEGNGKRHYVDFFMIRKISVMLICNYMYVSF